MSVFSMPCSLWEVLSSYIVLQRKGWQQLRSNPIDQTEIPFMPYIQAQMPHIHDRIDLYWDTTRQEKIRLIFVFQRIKIKLSILSTVAAVFHHALHRKGEPAWLTGLAPSCLPTMSVTRPAPPVPNTCMLPAGAMYYAVLLVCCIISCIICVKELVANSCREQGRVS